MPQPRPSHVVSQARAKSRLPRLERGMKAALASALGGMVNLDSSEVHERPVDRVGAAGAAGRTAPDQDEHGQQIERGKQAARNCSLAALGVDLIAFKFGHRTTSGKDAEDQLSAILAWDCWSLKL